MIVYAIMVGTWDSELWGLYSTKEIAESVAHWLNGNDKFPRYYVEEYILDERI